MFGPPTIAFDGKFYTLLEQWKPDPRLGRAVSGFAAERILCEMMRDSFACSALRERYMELAHVFAITHVPNETILRWFVHRLSDSFGADLQLFERDTLALLPAEEPPPKEVPADVQEARRIDGLIAQLGNQDLVHRGNSYRVSRAQRNLELPDRRHYEVASEREARSTVMEMAEDALRPERQRSALSELLQALDKHRGNKALELIVLRAYRMVVVPAEQSVPITPSQMKPKEDHWVEVWTVDPQGEPIPGVAVELLFANGDTKLAVTGEDGILHVASLKAGDVTIRLPGVNGEAWSAPGGTSPTPVGTAGPSRVHVVKKGENLSKIAHRYGVGGWKKLWEHPDNAGLRQKRKSPHVLYPGDEVRVPGVEVREVKRPLDQLHKLEVTRPTALEKLILVFRDCEGTLLANQPYEFSYTYQGKPVKDVGKLDKDGTLEKEIPVDLQSAHLAFPLLREQFDLGISDLHAIEKEEGVFVPEAAAARLAALGYLHRQADEGARLDVTAALCAFQFHVMEHENPTGQLDAQTCQKLEEMFGA